MAKKFERILAISEMSLKAVACYRGKLPKLKIETAILITAVRCIPLMGWLLSVLHFIPKN